ncbi:DUF4158 domain-containing protein [Microtetraspora malaysiensis]|uniref:DUF4158 domain-containing protein n=1 Tax=Microtetraspora malaysiensis TaxID=161358 RepID=UPI003D924871
MASIDRTAYPRFARAVSARELAEVFTPSLVEVEWARGKTQDDQHLLALLVWLKAYQRLGYFPKLADVPPVVAEHIRGVIGLAEQVVLTAGRGGVPCVPVAGRGIGGCHARRRRERWGGG